MKKIPLSFFVLLSFFVSINAQVNVSIGAWNIQWLGSPEMRPNVLKNIEQKPEDIARYISESKVDILALSEITFTDNISNQRRNRVLDAAFNIINEKDKMLWKYVLFPKKNQLDRTQLTGIAWNERKVKTVGTPFRLEMSPTDNLFSYWDRWATAVKFQTGGAGKTDLVIVPLHMKSNVGSKTPEQRDGEAAMLMQSLGSIRTRFSDEDIVFIGDTNILKNSETALSKFINAGFKDLNSADTPTVTHGKSPFDRAFIPSQPEFSIAAQDVFKLPNVDKNEFKKLYSDHYMIRFVVRVMNDDD